MMNKIKAFAKKEWQQIKAWLKDEKSTNGLGENGMLTALVILLVVVAGLVLWPFLRDGITNVGTRFENGTKNGSSQNWSNIRP